MMYVLQ